MIDLQQGDCLELLLKVKEKSVDMILADPPYCSGGMSITARKSKPHLKYQSSSVKSHFKNYQGDSRDQRSALLWGSLWLSLCLKGLKQGGSALVFCDWRQLANTIDMLQAGGFIYRGCIVWNKGNAIPQPNSFRQTCEYVIWGTKGDIDHKPKPDSKYLPGCYNISTVSSKNRFHMNQKPVELLEQLISLTPENGTVLDPFMGSGSTGVACVNTNRNFIGMELDEHYFEVAQNRIYDTVKNKEQAG